MRLNLGIKIGVRESVKEWEAHFSLYTIGCYLNCYYYFLHHLFL